MTVGELIAALREFPEDWEARVPDNSNFDNPVDALARGQDRGVVEVNGRKQWHYYDANAVNILGKYLP